MVKGKTWRSLDLTQHPQPSSLSPSSANTGLLSINCNLSTVTPHSPSQQHMLTPNTISNLAQIGGQNPPQSPSYYFADQSNSGGNTGASSRLDFKNRRSSSEPAQDLLAAQCNHSGCLALQQANQQQQQQSQLVPEENSCPPVVIFRARPPNPIECLDAALKVSKGGGLQGDLQFTVVGDAVMIIFCCLG